MRKISDVSDSCEYALRSSLRAIKHAHDQLHRLTGMGTTATVLASQIELCDVLLVEISGVRSSLCKDLNHTRGAPRPGGQMGWNI
jgi:hypothetical protein